MNFSVKTGSHQADEQTSLNTSEEGIRSYRYNRLFGVGWTCNIIS